mmetsp:Transcript_4675/g.10493  ORF Transcript_4675/g.10493 Transcript_4675/m.10493 type:complete len:246 (+) Transcript_4675:161-898(+)
MPPLNFGELFSVGSNGKRATPKQVQTSITSPASVRSSTPSLSPTELSSSSLFTSEAWSVDASPSSENDWSLKRSHRVQFSDKDLIIPTLALNDMTRRERNAIFYNKSDCNRMQKMVEKDSDAFERALQKTTATTNRDCSEIFSRYRGLERMTESGQNRCDKNIGASTRIVLLEQQRQRSSGIQDDEAIAGAYRRKTQHCQKKALVFGEMDAQQATIVYAEDDNLVIIYGQSGAQNNVACKRTIKS